MVGLVSSVIGQEGEQNGFYRVFLDQVPSESPFLTAVPAAFAFSALQLFVVPGSCPYPLSNIDLPIFPGLMVNGGPIAKVEPQDQTLHFQADLAGTDAAKKKQARGLYITYTTGQQLPISVEAQNAKWEGSVVTLDAKFPFEENLMAGFSHAALTTSNSFKNADAVVDCTLAAPGVIQVIDPIGINP